MVKRIAVAAHDDGVLQAAELSNFISPRMASCKMVWPVLGILRRSGLPLALAGWAGSSP
ncbi:MAG: hypothetical protein H6656_02680 [Ardenticatenaceae bacterium]|nr:hypothetical protein [Ardenticatenaceae bacterium]